MRLTARDCVDLSAVKPCTETTAGKALTTDHRFGGVESSSTNGESKQRRRVPTWWGIFVLRMESR
jgi:hypothetical protein